MKGGNVSSLRIMFRRCITVAAVLVFTFFTAGSSGAAVNAPAQLTIAYQPGIGYAPILVMKEAGWLEHDFPQMSVQWRQLSNGAAIRDGMISGKIQAGVLAAGPFLIGWAHGVDWKIISNVSDMDLWLCTMNPHIHSLKDIKTGMQIGMPAPDSIEAVVLRKGAEEQLGNAHALDTNIVAIPHPEGLTALVNGQLTAHLTSAPFEFEEVAHGAHVILDSKSLFGKTTFVAAVMPTSFYDQYPGFAAAFRRDVQRAIKLIETNPALAARYVAQAESKPSLTSQFKGWMTHKGVSYTTRPSGFLKIAAFMEQIGMISKAPTNTAAIEFPAAQKLGRR
ncbi:MAG: ABC transporter substrate-binding protein [Vulcanimicrobiaceae bacterium]